MDLGLLRRKAMTQSVRTGLVAAFFTAGLAFGQSPSPSPAMPPPAPAASAPTATPKTVELKDQKGKLVGTVLLVDTPHGLLLRGALSGLPAGTHAIHFHEIGKCEAPFKSSGGH